MIETLLTVASSVAAVVEVVKQGLRAWEDMPDWAYRLIIILTGAIGGIFAVLMTPQLLAIFVGTPLETNPVMGTVLLGLSLGVFGSKGVHLLMGLLQATKDLADALANKTVMSSFNTTTVSTSATSSPDPVAAQAVAQTLAQDKG
jgi:hypothetical protein